MVFVRITLFKRSLLPCILISSTLLVFWFSYEKYTGKVLSGIFTNNSQSSTKPSKHLTGSVTVKNGVEPLLLFVGIYSAAKYLDRRNAIRETWLTECKSNEKVLCRFFTNRQDLKGNPLPVEVQRRLRNESRLHGDLIYAKSPPGQNFARRYLWMIKWARDHYDFKYLLRLDDDYFLCFRKLVNELEFHRPRQHFTWGWLHCFPGTVYLDEGFFLVTKDIIDYFLSRVNKTLLCHPFADQAFGIWLNNYTNRVTFGDNGRLFHLNFEPKHKAVERSEICQTALGIHKSYPEEMKIYWYVYLKEPKDQYKVPPVVYPCHLKPYLNYKVFVKPWFAEPKPCKDNPVWGASDYYIGRGGK